MDKDTKEKLKAYFASKFLSYGDAYESSGGCETCGPDVSGFTMETISDLIDKFDPDKIN